MVLMFSLSILDTKSQCSDDYPTYYSFAEDLYMYQSYDPESAQISFIPYGKSVKVIQSSSVFGGWWQICYDSKIGWAKKSKLTNNFLLLDNAKMFPVFKEEPKKRELVSEGDDGYMITTQFFKGKTVKTETFKTWNGYDIKLKAGTELYMINTYTGIDTESGKIGTIKSTSIRKVGPLSVNLKGICTNTGKIASQVPKLEVWNYSKVELTVLVGDLWYTMKPKSYRKFNAPMDIKCWFIVTAPGYIPIIVHQLFKSYNNYQFKFIVD